MWSHRGKSACKGAWHSEIAIVVVVVSKLHSSQLIDCKLVLFAAAAAIITFIIALIRATEARNDEQTVVQHSVWAPAGHILGRR